MKVVLAYSHVDAVAALRLLAWMAHIGGKPENLLVVSTIKASRLQTHRDIRAYLAEEYPQAQTWILPDQREVGWPRACTHMFSRSLEHANDDIFWIEPDCVPITPDWWTKLKAEYEAGGTTFMGRRVPASPNHVEHMTGVAFYGKNWKTFAPQLGDPYAGKHGAWDVDQAPHILKDFTETKLIQHEWIRHKAGVEARAEDLEPQAVLYHQCKSGALMKQLRPDFDMAPLTSRCQLVTTNNIRTMNFYLVQDASKPVVSGGRTFRFDPAEYMTATHSWWGIYKTQVPEEIIALDSLVDRGLIEVIPEEDFNKLELKKKKAPVSLNLVFSQNVQGLQESQRPAPAAPPAASAAEVAVTRMVEATEDIVTPRKGRSRK